jgi:HK97 gp10 family phage protein
MTDQVRVVTNLPDFKRQLQSIAFDMQKRAVATAARAGTKVLKALAVQGAPELQKPDTRKVNPRVRGTLRRAIYAGVAYRRSKPGLVVSTVGVYRKDKTRGKKTPKTTQGAFYWYFLEAGWVPRGPGRRLRGGERTKRLERSRSVSRQIKKPFLKPALDAGAGRAVEAFNASMQKSIDRYNRIK